MGLLEYCTLLKVLELDGASTSFFVFLVELLQHRGIDGGTEQQPCTGLVWLPPVKIEKNNIEG